MIRRGVLVALLLGAALADARPGGGHSSSGGGRSSSSSHSYGGGGGYRGGGGSMSMEAMIAMLVIIVIIYAISAAVKSQAGKAWTSAPIAAEVFQPPDVGTLVERDPDFSRAVFEDLAFELYAAAHRTRGDPALPLAPYLSPGALGQLAARGAPPEQVVIGTLRIESIGFATGGGPARDQIMVRIEATLLGPKRSVFAVEHWQFTRATGAKSKPPVRTRTWPCPNCGAPWQAGATRTCAYCGEDVAVGRFDWAVEQIWVDSETPALASLTGTVEEYGNDLPTVVDPYALAQLGAITADDPQVTFQTLEPRIRMIYGRLNDAWNASDLGPVRGFVTGALRGYLEYWLREYARQGLRNKLENAQVQRVQLAKVTRDKFYDAITVRIFADGNDYTLDANDKVVGGSKKARRAYTEYWTFLRSSTRRGPVVAEPKCANCGAPISISDVGDCTHCNATVENGSFDWTLSKIEQDDWYAG